jgi:hypothetical protein
MRGEIFERVRLTPEVKIVRIRRATVGPLLKSLV